MFVLFLQQPNSKQLRFWWRAQWEWQDGGMLLRLILGNHQRLGQRNKVAFPQFFSGVLTTGSDSAVFAVKLCGDVNTAQVLPLMFLSSARPPLICNSS